MAFYIEYRVSAAEDEHFDIPVNDQEPGYTVPLSETDAPVISAKDLPIRSGVFGSTLDEARSAAEEIIGHSKATAAKLFEDDENSNDIGSGTLLAEYSEDTGWTDTSTA